MIKAKNKIYVGSNPEGYLDPDIMTVIFEYLVEHDIRDHSKAKPRKIGDNYLLEIEANESTKLLISGAFYIIINIYLFHQEQIFLKSQGNLAIG